MRGRATDNSIFTRLSPLCILHKEAEFVSLQACLVSRRKLRRHQRQTFVRYQARLFSQWSLYTAGEQTVYQLLAACVKELVKDDATVLPAT